LHDYPSHANLKNACSGPVVVKILVGG